jgi:hypothetical protein
MSGERSHEIAVPVGSRAPLEPTRPRRGNRGRFRSSRPGQDVFVRVPRAQSAAARLVPPAISLSSPIQEGDPTRPARYRKRENPAPMRVVAVARPGLEPGTPRFSVVRSKRSNSGEFLQISRFTFGLRSVGCPQIPFFCRRFGRWRAPHLPIRRRARKVPADGHARPRSRRAGSLMGTPRRRSRVARDCEAATTGSRRGGACRRRADCRQPGCRLWPLRGPAGRRAR